MNNEFLSPRENSCKWFNGLGVMRKCIYIEKCGKRKVSAKNNTVNRFSKCVNRHRQLNDKHDDNEDWYVSDTLWIDSNVPRWRLIWFKILWIDSNKVIKFHDTIQHNLNRFMGVYSVKLWIDSLWYYSGKLWIDSLWCYSWKLESIQKVWHKKNGHKECFMWIIESWIESSDSQKDFPIHDNT